MGGWGGERLQCGTGEVFKVSAVERDVQDQSCFGAERGCGVHST